MAGAAVSSLISWIPSSREDWGGKSRHQKRGEVGIVKNVTEWKRRGEET